MNTIELLLKMDAKKIQMPTKEVVIKRLSDAAGAPVKFKLQGVDSPTSDSIREMAMKDNGTINIDEVRKATILAGVKEPNLRDSSLAAHFGAATPYDLIDKILAPGEKDALYGEITNLSGYDEDAVAEVKN